MAVVLSRVTFSKSITSSTHTERSAPKRAQEALGSERLEMDEQGPAWRDVNSAGPRPCYRTLRTATMATGLGDSALALVTGWALSPCP